MTVRLRPNPLADGRLVRYRLFGFVSITNDHAIAYLRVGPRHFKICDDDTVTWGAIGRKATSVSEHPVLAFYMNI
jgi:hypothetical protein